MQSAPGAKGKAVFELSMLPGNSCTTGHINKAVMLNDGGRASQAWPRGNRLSQPLSVDESSGAKFQVENGRSGRIRTDDPLTPSQVRYRAALHSGPGGDVS